MNREEAIAILHKLKQDALTGAVRHFEPFDGEELFDDRFYDALNVAIEDLQSISALSADLKAVNRDSMDKKTLIGFNMAVALMNKHLGGAE